MVRRLVSEDRANHKEARSMRMVSSPDVLMWCANLPVSEPLRLCLRFSLLRLLGFSIPFWFNRRLVDVRGKLALEFLDSTVAPAFCNRLRHRIREDFLLLFIHPV